MKTEISFMDDGFFDRDRTRPCKPVLAGVLWWHRVRGWGRSI
jgi:hypothetical protein